jgi:hypothetical protein
VALDGSAGRQEILDTDGGLYDNDLVYDRAVGPMQSIPQTWVSVGMAAGCRLAPGRRRLPARGTPLSLPPPDVPELVPRMPSVQRGL